MRALGERWLLAGIVFLAAGAQLWFALGKGFLLDEFHSHFHATQSSWASFLEDLLKDNHPPLSFLAIKASISIFGDSELSARLPSILFALLEIVFVWRLVKEFGRGAACCAATMLAVSSLHLDISVQARMYSLHSLAVTGACLALLRILSGKSEWKVRAALAFWLWVGVHNHYFFLHYALGMGVAVITVACVLPSYRQKLRALALPVAVAIVLALPWFLFGFPQQLGHGLPPGGDDLGLLSLLESYIHLFFLNVRLGTTVPGIGGILREIYILSGAAVTVMGVVGAWLGTRPAQPDRVRAATITMLSIGFFVPCWAAVLAWNAPRFGFTWHYVLPSAAALAWLTAMAWRLGNPIVVKPTLLFALTAAASLSFLNATGRGTEDYPGAIASILAKHQAGDLVIAVEWQPALFPGGMPWDYYANRLVPNPPMRLKMAHSDFILDTQRIHAGTRVFVLRTSLPMNQRLFKLLAARGLRMVHSESFGYGVEVLVFE